MTPDSEKNLFPVSLVGAGPGDPGLITARGLERLRAADVVVYDALANPVLLAEARPDAILVDAGKRAKEHRLTQDQTNALLVEHARAGRRVCRLKGGDPYLFGRGAEEATYLARHGIACEVIPGITAGIAGPAYAGIPVTHREHASTVTFVTGHEDPTKGRTSVDYAGLAGLVRAGGTACFYMGVGRLEAISDQLQQHGLAASTPAAAVQWGTLPRQRTVRGTLANLAERVAEAQLGAPAIIVVGPVAGIDDPGLDFFTSRPLHGKRIVVTRTRQQASELTRQLRELGADVLEAPTIELEPPGSWDAIDEAIRHLDRHDWLVLTSANAVAVLAERVDALDFDARHFAQVQIAAVGAATAAALRERLGIRADFIPVTTSGEALAEEMREARYMEGAKVLLLRADIARPALPEGLRAGGAVVTELAAYRTRLAESLPEDVVEAIRERSVDWVTFTSGSTARNLVTLLGSDAAALQDVRTASIGPVTSAAMRGAGLPVTVEAAEPSIAALVAAIAASPV